MIVYKIDSSGRAYDLQFKEVPDTNDILLGKGDVLPDINLLHTGVYLSQLEAQKTASAQKAADIAANLPSWAEVATAIDNATTLAALKVIVKKMARILYWLAKNSAT